jgi:hypothetical protein
MIRGIKLMAWIEGELHISSLLQAEEEDVLSIHRNWLMQEQKIQAQEVNNIKCGYMTSDKIQLFKHTGEPVDTSEISTVSFMSMTGDYGMTFGLDDVTIYNGINTPIMMGEFSTV